MVANIPGKNLAERKMQFDMLELPGQPQGMHMGTAYLMNDMWQEVRTMRAVLREIAGYTGEGPSTTPWQEIVRTISKRARDTLIASDALTKD